MEVPLRRRVETAMVVLAPGGQDLLAAGVGFDRGDGSLFDGGMRMLGGSIIILVNAVIPSSFTDVAGAACW